MAYWGLAALLLLASGWSLNLATYNWFAADQHDQYSLAYASRGNGFFGVALILFVAFVSVVVAILRTAKKRNVAES